MNYTLQFPDDIFNPKFLKYLWEIQSTVEILFGSAGSSKTVHSAMKDVLRLVQAKNVVAVRQVYNTLEDSYYQDVKKAVSTLGMEGHFSFKRSPLRVECTTGAVMLFRGLDDVEKLKGITVPQGQIDHFTIEEATETSEYSINQLQFRSRGGGSRLSLDDIELMKDRFDDVATLEEMNSDKFKFDIFKALGFEDRENFEQCEKTMTLLFNPINRDHWICKRFFEDSEGNAVFEIEDGEYISPELYIMHSTHWDNLFLTMDDHRRYEQYKFIDSYYHEVYARGRWGVLGDLILSNFKLADMSEDFLSSIPTIRLGMDFGDVDPTAIGRVGINKQKREIYIIDEIGQSGNDIDSIESMLGAFLWHPEEVINCDVNEKITRNSLKKMGYKLLGVDKGGKTGYKLQFYRILRSYTIYINWKKCPNFAREIKGFVWPVDKRTGNKIEEIPDGNDHYLDACLMYALNRDLWEIMPSRIYGG